MYITGYSDSVEIIKINHIVNILRESHICYRSNTNS